MQCGFTNGQNEFYIHLPSARIVHLWRAARSAQVCSLRFVQRFVLTDSFHLSAEKWMKWFVHFNVRESKIRIKRVGLPITTAEACITALMLQCIVGLDIRVYPLLKRLRVNGFHLQHVVALFQVENILSRDTYSPTTWCVRVTLMHYFLKQFSTLCCYLIYKKIYKNICTCHM